ncbi:cysteine--tRNA ligase [Jannaschia pagri]|uniref:Cysteine--tRNA ligase n=1 Tax=Jannaschia pagri TaxID=2829797 RepID=A0ABQ4NPF4_9RHOB|nr:MULTISPECIES: cysteine--tRNA ligase [unclassified Jannaschia]GIT92132.1 cysteine--tRNA ligase [Jannaschia sp. AI_61]GIT95967.1 cysteine--tRNA ligase [Jannaschia sp. AI_62]
MDRAAMRLRNSMTRQVEGFVPLDPSNVRLYLCGPTVYDRAHLGNARNVILFDVLFRLLRHDHGLDHVTYVRNFTDVDDKINARAAETGRDISDITEETIGWYHADMDALGNLRPTHEPRATEYIAEMIAMIEGLIASGHAYAAEGHVLFSVAADPQYGSLSGRSVDDMIAGARVEVAPYKRDPMDFVLWKPSGPELPGWDSPWGRGRPGWHIECSAMSKALLGTSFDIHGGGNDLMFPHHENERAQSCCADPDAGHAQIWLHNEMLLVEGRKMSKSLGNFFTVRDLLDQGVPGEVIRFVFLSTHYSKPMDWTEDKAREAKKTLIKWYRQASMSTAQDTNAHPEVLRCLRDDLNTHGALAECFQLYAAGDFGALRGSMNLLGLGFDKVPAWASEPSFEEAELALVTDLLNARDRAKGQKNYAKADQIRDGLAAAGVIVQDTKDGPQLSKSEGFDIEQLNDLWGRI